MKKRETRIKRTVAFILSAAVMITLNTGVSAENMIMTDRSPDQYRISTSGSVNTAGEIEVEAELGDPRGKQYEDDETVYTYRHYSNAINEMKKEISRWGYTTNYGEGYYESDKDRYSLDPSGITLWVEPSEFGDEGGDLRELTLDDINMIQYGEKNPFT